MPKLLSDRFGLGTYQLGLAVAFIYLIADFGAVLGGWVSSRLIRRGHGVNYARKISLLLAALGTLPVISVAWLDAGMSPLGVPAVWITVAIVSLAAASHQAWSSNVYTIVSDTLPRAAVATTVGVSQAFGAVGSSIFQFLVAIWLVKTGNYSLPLILAGTLYFVGLAALHLILPRLQPASIEPGDRPRVRPWHVAAGAAVVIGGLIGLQALLTLNQHPYRSLDHYLQKRQGELQAAAYGLGPKAKVGWQEAQWVRWSQPDGTAKLELVKLDRDGRPTVEGKGATAKKYDGPARDEVERAVGGSGR
jgi:ACS family hexuronate transporter-like MFS transporter